MNGSDLPGSLQRLSWESPAEPSPASVAERLRAEGVDPYSWSNAPGDRYAPHTHAYTKLLMCAAGSITFLVGEGEDRVELRPGEGFVLPPNTAHAALVGPEGCTCLEGHRVNAR
jgi:quercetin dioxygenase-like cupin family protein